MVRTRRTKDLNLKAADEASEWLNPDLNLKGEDSSEQLTPELDPEDQPLTPPTVHTNWFSVLEEKRGIFQIIDKWYCINCTLVQSFESPNCEFCKEDRNSDVLGALVQEAEHTKFYSTKDHSGEESTIVGYDKRMLLHEEVGKELCPPHERPDRLTAIACTLEAAGIFPGHCSSILPRKISSAELEKVHTKGQIHAVEKTSSVRSRYLSEDTYTNQHSSNAAKLAAAICSDLATTIFKGEAKNGFALVRPPGHHAGVSKSTGFCLHNNAAVAASAAKEMGAKKILILDWDVHHGNGTQQIFDADRSVLYISIHRFDRGKFYPHTGAADKVGVERAKGFSVNIPWNCAGVGDCDYLSTFKHIVIPIASQFSPELTIVSAGFDAVRGDPLGSCDVTPRCYAEMTSMLASICGKLLVILEGGYNLRSISASAKAVVEVLLGGDPGGDRKLEPSISGIETIREVLAIQSRFWKLDCSVFPEKAKVFPKKAKATRGAKTSNEQQQEHQNQQQQH